MEKEEKNPQRLCSEIQLFDLCAEDICSYRAGRFCTRTEILAKFEAICDDDTELSPEMYVNDDEEMAEDIDERDYDQDYDAAGSSEEDQEEDY